MENLDAGDANWTSHWKEHHQDYLAGHWFRKPGGDSWTLPIDIVAGIKSKGLRADDPSVILLHRDQKNHRK